MDKLPLSPRTDGTFDFFGTFLQTGRVEDLGDQMLSSAEPIERLGAYMELRQLATRGVSHEVRRIAQEKLDTLVPELENT